MCFQLAAGLPLPAQNAGLFRLSVPARGRVVLFRVYALSYQVGTSAYLEVPV